MDEDTDQGIESMIREGWAATGLPASELPESGHPRMQVLVAVVRLARRDVHAQLLRLAKVEAELSERIGELEARVQSLEDRVGVGHTLQ
jgi:hypothetical protein